MSKQPKNHCRRCYDLPWRRPKTKPCDCGEAYHEEDLREKQQAPTPVSALGEVVP